MLVKMENREVAVAWANLTYKIKSIMRKSETTILNQLYGCVEFGTITAMMGPSGAGKTTLLKCINGKLRQGLDRHSQIYMNANRKVISCFVEQNDQENLIMCLTAKENLMFASKLRNSNHKCSVGAINHESIVNNIMDQLMMADICDTRVDCCSGGQQKRLIIAMEMVKVVKPNLFCIDEPTTGLDSNIAEIIMNCLVNLAKKHSIAVIAIIHQPNHEILKVLDKVYILAKGGSCVFSGRPQHIGWHLRQNKIEINENQVPIENLIKLSSIDADQQDLDELIDKTRETLKRSILHLCQNQNQLIIGDLEKDIKSFKLNDMWYIMIRTMTQLYLRQWKAYVAQLLFYVLFALCSCRMFNENVGKPNACFNENTLANDTCLEELENNALLFQNQNLLFTLSVLISYSHICTIAMSYCDQAKMFFYEHQNSWYSTASYYWGTSIVDFLPTLLFGTSYGLIIYLQSGQFLETGRLLGYVFIIGLSFLISEAIGKSVGVVFRNYPVIAVMVGIGYSASMGIFSDFYIPISDMPITFQYASDLCFAKYLFHSALLLVYGFNRCSSQEKSFILLKYNLTDELLKINLYKLLFFLLVSKIFVFLGHYFMTEKRINLKTSQQKITTNDSIDSYRRRDESFKGKRSQNFTQIKMKNLNHDNDINVDLETNFNADSVEMEENSNDQACIKGVSRKISIANFKKRMSIDKFARRISISNLARRMSNSNIGRRMSSIGLRLNTRRKTIYICSDNFEVDLDLDDDGHKKPMSIAWTDLTLRIPTGMFTTEKMILNNINGFFEFGTINALMGPSGTGKTTLMNCINGLYNEYLTDESVIILSKFKKIKSCFITQNQLDHILSGLTGQQVLTYASKFKNSDKHFDHKNNVKQIMEELLLTNTCDTNVEDCSGGEQKRLVVAMELTADIKPNLLCVDEPTSGLDSNAADVIIKTLKRLSMNHNICVITSIHQPNNDLLLMFDKLYVLSKGGHCVYSGRPKRLIRHLMDCDIECSEGQLPIEVLLKYSCNELDNKYVKELFEKTTQITSQLIESRSPYEGRVYLDGIGCISLSKRFYFRDLWLLIQRGLTYNLRFYWKIILFQFIVYILFGLLMRSLYNPNIGTPSGCISFDDDFNDTCSKTETKLEWEKQLITNMKYNLYVMICVVLFTMVATVLSFTFDIKVFFNEQRNGWYSTGVFYWSKSIVELIPIVITVVCFSYVVDIYEPQKSMFLKYAFLMTLGALQVQSISHVIGILTAESTRMGVFIIIGLMIFSFIFSNVLIPVKELHYSLQVISNFSIFKLLVETAMISFYGLGRCSDREFSYILFLLDIEDINLYINVELIILQFFLFRFIALIILLLKVNPIVNTKKDEEKRKFFNHELNSTIKCIKIF